ncbi:unnamed protein product [Linum trigynum]|uniref:Uncharacterized protein n=1 Tax=Linum trigynum TaxID=586398 RepID=A0AAV2DYT1_9ROSI
MERSTVGRRKGVAVSPVASVLASHSDNQGKIQPAYLFFLEGFWLKNESVTFFFLGFVFERGNKRRGHRWCRVYSGEGSQTGARSIPSTVKENTRSARKKLDGYIHGRKNMSRSSDEKSAK